MIDCRGALVIQRVGVEALTLLGHAGPHLALHVFIFEQRVDVVPDCGNGLPLDAAGLSRSDNTALAAYQ